MTIILDHMEQGSREWDLARIGCVTMSNAKALTTGGEGKTRASYIMQVASEAVTGVPSERISTWDMERGILLEAFARQSYESETGRQVKTVGLGYLDDTRRIAASPDGLTSAGGLEIKCQAPKNHMATIIKSKYPEIFNPQMQGSMWVFDVDQWDYCSYCPEFKERPLFIMTAYRDEKMISKIRDSALRAVEEIDELVEQARNGKINKRTEALRLEALELIRIMQNKEPEII